MKTQLTIKIIFLAAVVGLSGPLYAKACCASTQNASAQPADPNSDPLKVILDHLQKNAAELTSCTAKIEYLIIQDPDLLDSHTLRKGTMSYLKSNGLSRVLLKFYTLKQDDFDEQKRPETYLFDGVWLTKIDYALKQADIYQQAPEDKPLDAFDFISHHFPLVGFSGSKNFEKDFEVSLIQPAASENPNLAHLLLNVREESRYSKDYKKIDFWIDKKLYLPHRVLALSTQGDIYDIRFLDIQTNKKLEKSVFVVEIPKDFAKNIESLNQETQTKGEN